MLHALRENSEQKQNRDAHSSCDIDSQYSKCQKSILIYPYNYLINYQLCNISM